MDICEMRERLKNCPKYASDNWSLKVDQMKPRQVYAIYKNFLKKKLFRTGRRKEPKLVYRQITLFELYPEIMRGEKE